MGHSVCDRNGTAGFPQPASMRDQRSALVQSPHLMLEGDGRFGIDLK
jgi:hypothetical protein